MVSESTIIDVYLIYNYLDTMQFWYLHIVDINSILSLQSFSVTHSNQGPSKLNAADEVHSGQEHPAF